MLGEYLDHVESRSYDRRGGRTCSCCRQVLLRLADGLRNIGPALRCSNKCLCLRGIRTPLIHASDLIFASRPACGRLDTLEHITQGNFCVENVWCRLVERDSFCDHLLGLQEYLPFHLVD